MPGMIWYQWEKDSRVYYLREGNSVRVRIGARLSDWVRLGPGQDLNDLIGQMKFELERSE